MLMMSEERKKARFVLFRCLGENPREQVPAAAPDSVFKQQLKRPGVRKTWLEL